MKWTVEGAYQDSGDEVSMTIEAETKESAERRANRRGIIISSVAQAEPTDAIDENVIRAIQTQASTAQKLTDERATAVTARMMGNGSVAPRTNENGKPLCASCGSDRLASAEMICLSGTTTSTFAGIGFDGGGGTDFVGGASTSKTALAQRMAAPRPKSRLGMMLAVGFVGVAIFAMTMPLINSDLSWIGVSAVAFVLLVFAIAGISADSPARRFNKREHGLLLARWKRTWCCLDCGTSFIK